MVRERASVKRRLFMADIVRSDSFGVLAYDFAARKLVTLFKERVTIFGDKPRLLIPMGADNGEKCARHFGPKTPKVGQQDAAGYTITFPRRPRIPPEKRLETASFFAENARFGPGFARPEVVLGCRVPCFYQYGQVAAHRGRGSVFTTPPQPFPARPLACRAA